MSLGQRPSSVAVAAGAPRGPRSEARRARRSAGPARGGAGDRPRRRPRTRGGSASIRRRRATPTSSPPSLLTTTVPSTIRHDAVVLHDRGVEAQRAGLAIEAGEARARGGRAATITAVSGPSSGAPTGATCGREIHAPADLRRTTDRGGGGASRRGRRRRRRRRAAKSASLIDRDVRGEAKAIAEAPHDLAGEHVERRERRIAAGDDHQLAGAPQAEAAAARAPRSASAPRPRGDRSPRGAARPR